jgi:hypothetical protein
MHVPLTHLYPSSFCSTQHVLPESPCQYGPSVMTVHPVETQSPVRPEGVVQARITGLVFFFPEQQYGQAMTVHSVAGWPPFLHSEFVACL